MNADLVSYPDPSTWHKGQILLVQSVAGMGGGERKYRLERILGGGLTSIVWQADQLDENDVFQCVAALKVLRPDAGRQYVDGLYDEQYILRSLWKNLKDHSIEFPAIPEVYGFSPKDADIRYISMELVPGRPAADLVGYQSRLPARIQEVRQNAALFVPMLETLKSDSYAEPDVDENIKQLAIEILSSGEKIIQFLGNMDALIENRPSSPVLLSEKDIITIGLQTSQVLQTLEDELKRSYLDFQLKNFYFDAEKQQLKIIDFNVVSAEGTMDIPADIFKLAGGLFFLLTKVSIEKPSKLEEIRNLGGPVWSEQVTRAMRMVLERSLQKTPETPFTKVFDWDKAKDWEMLPLSVVQSVGTALEIILSYWNADLLKLQILTQAHLKNALPEDAYAVLQIAQIRLVSEGQPDDGNYAENFKELKERIDQLLQAPLQKLELAKDWLEGKDRDRARQAIEIAYKGAPQDLMICRWKELIEQLNQLTFDEFKKLWDSGNLHVGMQALAEKRWLKAQEKLGAIGGLNNSLVADAALNQEIEATSRSYLVFRMSDNEQIVENFQLKLNKLSLLLSAPQPVYKELILRNWPEYEEWLMYAEERKKNQAEFRETLREIKEVTHD